MDIEKSIGILKVFRNYNKFYKEENKNLTITITLETKESIDKAIERLLTAYEKEKEKREIAEENHKVLSLDLGKALKELGLYEDTIIADELALEINKRFVSKNKIKPIQIIDLDGKIHNVYKIEEE